MIGAISVLGRALDVPHADQIQSLQAQRVAGCREVIETVEGSRFRVEEGSVALFHGPQQF